MTATTKEAWWMDIGHGSIRLCDLSSWIDQKEAWCEAKCDEITLSRHVFREARYVIGSQKQTVVVLMPGAEEDKDDHFYYEGVRFQLQSGDGAEVKRMRRGN